MYRGRYQLGKHLPIGVQCVNATRVPSAPTAAPSFRIYKHDATFIIAGSLPPTERYLATGLFEYRQFLTAAFSVGWYYVRYTWAVLGVNFAAFDAFEVVAGGSAGGQINSMFFLDRTDGDWIVTQSDSGNTNINRGPRL